MSDPREYFGGPLDGTLYEPPPAMRGNPPGEFIVGTNARPTPDGFVTWERHLYRLEPLGVRYEYAGRLEDH